MFFETPNLEITPSFEVFSIKPMNEKKKKSASKQRPAKQPNPYFLFCQERRTQLQAEHPELPSRNITAMLAQEWHSLSEIDRQTYTSRYIQNMEAIQLEKEKENGRKKLIMLQIPMGDGKYMTVPAFFPQL